MVWKHAKHFSGQTRFEVSDTLQAVSSPYFLFYGDEILCTFEKMLSDVSIQLWWPSAVGIATVELPGDPSLGWFAFACGQLGQWLCVTDASNASAACSHDALEEKRRFDIRFGH